MRQGKRYFWGMMLATTAVAIGGAAPAAASRAGCFANAPSGAKTVAQSGAAIVLAAHGRLYGCSYDRERVHELPGQGDGQRIMRDSVEVERRNAAYGSLFNGSSVTVYSVRLRSGHVWAASDDLPWADGVRLEDLVLRGNGSIAWQFSYRYSEPDGWTRVLGFDHNGSGGPRFHEYDSDESGSDEDRQHRIIRSSLGLSHVGSSWRIVWSRRGESAISAPIN